MTNERIVTVREAAKELRISVGSAYNAVKTGELPSVKIGNRILIPRAPLDRLLNGEGSA